MSEVEKSAEQGQAASGIEFSEFDQLLEQEFKPKSAEAKTAVIVAILHHPVLRIRLTPTGVSVVNGL